MPPETHLGSTIGRKDKEKELRRVYRKLKGVRSQLSVKMRKLKKEFSETEHEDVEEEDIIPDEKLADEPQESDLDKKFTEARRLGKTGKATDGTQYEVKSLVDHKNRLRKRFWKLQEEVRESR